MNALDISFYFVKLFLINIYLLIINPQVEYNISSHRKDPTFIW